MKFQILMATMHKKSISDIDWQNKQISSPVLLINQSNFEGVEQQANIQMISTTERGSSKSRNKAIKNASGEICLLADDDVIYKSNYEDIILKAFKKYPDADIITFQIETPEGHLFNPSYPNSPQPHNWRSILRCASIEIAFKLESIKKANLALNENFGLGSKYKVHDEPVFLNDALKKGLKIYYEPIPIVIHPAESSGTTFNNDLVFSKGAAFGHLFGSKAYAFNLWFTLKKYPLYQKNYSHLQFFRMMCSGTNHYIKEKKNVKN